MRASCPSRVLTQLKLKQTRYCIKYTKLTILWRLDGASQTRTNTAPPSLQGRCFLQVPGSTPLDADEAILDTVGLGVGLGGAQHDELLAGPLLLAEHAAHQEHLQAGEDGADGGAGQHVAGVVHVVHDAGQGDPPGGQQQQPLHQRAQQLARAAEQAPAARLDVQLWTKSKTSAKRERQNDSTNAAPRETLTVR